MDINAQMGYSGMASTFLGGLTSAFGAYEQGQSEGKMYDYQAGVARMNAQIAEQNASTTSATGEFNAMLSGLRGAATMGTMKAAQASHGLDVRSGSAQQVQQSQGMFNQLNQSAIRSDAAKTAYNYRTQAAASIAEAGADTFAGENARTAGMIKADTSLIGAASSVSQQWLQGQKAGLPGNNSNQTFWSP